MRKIIIILIITLTSFFSAIYFYSSSEPKMIILNHMSKISEASLNQVILIENPPSESYKLKKIISAFNQNNQKNDGKIERLFVQNPNYKLFPALTLSKNIDYSSESSTRDDLYNMDFLATYSSYTSLDGERINTIFIYDEK